MSQPDGPCLGRLLAFTPASDEVALWCGGHVVRVALSRLHDASHLRPGDWLQRRADAWVLAAQQPAARPEAAPRELAGEVARFLADDGLRFRNVCLRAALLRAIRSFFDARGFIEIDPPALAVSPGLEQHLDAVGATLREGMGGRPVTRWLVTSPEYHMKRLLVAGFERIYSLGHAFRSGERGNHHNPEFAMLEWYRAGERYPVLIEDTEALVRHCQAALVAAARQVGGPPLPAAVSSEATPFVRLTVREAVQRHAGYDPGDADDGDALRRRARAVGQEVADWETCADVLTRTLVERVEPALDPRRGVVLERWPVALASLARRFDDDPKHAERFEIYLGGAELANGFSELTDATEQGQRFAADLAARAQAGLPCYPIDEAFLAALDEGCPPAAGVALGVDRLLMWLTGSEDIEEVLAFPFERA